LPRLIGRVRRGLDAARADDLFLYSAALAFYGLISVAPLVVVALWVTSLVVGPAQIHEAAGELARFSPEALGADRALERVADLGTGLGVVAVIAALWPATAYGSALARVLDRLAGDRNATGLRRRGAALGLVGVAPVLVLGSLLASYAGATAFGDTPVELAGGLAVGLVFGSGATFVTVAFIYRIFPSTPPDWRSTTHGALVAAVTIAVLSVAYVAYLRLGANFERRYASDALAAVVLLGLWLFAANSALLVGYRVAHRRVPEDRHPKMQQRFLAALQLPGGPQKSSEDDGGEADGEADDPACDVLVDEDGTEDGGEADDATGGEHPHGAPFELRAAPCPGRDHRLRWLVLAWGFGRLQRGPPFWWVALGTLSIIVTGVGSGLFGWRCGAVDIAGLSSGRIGHGWLLGLRSGSRGVRRGGRRVHTRRVPLCSEPRAWCSLPRRHGYAVSLCLYDQAGSPRPRPCGHAADQAAGGARPMD
jgi:membrane protein